jgi:16S rRNA (guanine1207-N2)-methyltransferase
MEMSRLTLAARDGLLTLPDGQATVFRPASDLDLSVWDAAQVHIVHGFMPEYEALQTRGYSIDPDTAPNSAASVVVAQRSKAYSRALIHRACMTSPDGLILVDGQKTDGIDSLYKEARKRTNVLGTLTKAHGRLFWFGATDAFADWVDTPSQAGAYQTQSGVFSADKVDRGSQLLAQALPEKLPNRIADLGAGWGYLSDHILKRDNVKSLDLIEAEHRALSSARLNITDPRAAFHWADATTFKPTDAYQMVVTNPPFHTGRSATPELGQAFITSAAKMLIGQGTLLLVANRHLPYETLLADRFHNVSERVGDAGFKVLQASRPKR